MSTSTTPEAPVAPVEDIRSHLPALERHQGVFVSHGDFYATTVAHRLGRAGDGLLRAGCACYTTAAEVDRLVEGAAGLAH